jgi:PTS system nitrogen regulatory IIA component
MQLSVKDVARILSVKETTVYRWIEKAALPGHRINNQYRFNRAELFEWATANNVTISAELFTESEENTEPFAGLYNALSAGGIFYGIPAVDKPSALSGIVKRMPLPEGVNREFLLNILLAREALASTGIGNGIAIPHVRNPIVLRVPHPSITLSFLENPIDFSAIDNQPVYCLFTIISPTVRVHLHLLSQLSVALRNSEFQHCLKIQAPEQEIYRQIQRIDRELNGSPASSPGQVDGP